MRFVLNHFVEVFSPPQPRSENTPIFPASSLQTINHVSISCLCASLSIFTSRPIDRMHYLQHRSLSTLLIIWVATNMRPSFGIQWWWVCVCVCICVRGSKWTLVTVYRAWNWASVTLKQGWPFLNCGETQNQYVSATQRYMLSLCHSEGSVWYVSFVDDAHLSMTLLLHSSSRTRISISSFRWCILEETKHVIPVSLLQSVTREGRHTDTPEDHLFLFSRSVPRLRSFSPGLEAEKDYIQSLVWMTMMTRKINNIGDSHSQQFKHNQRDNNRVNVSTVLVWGVDYSVIW